MSSDKYKVAWTSRDVIPCRDDGVEGSDSARYKMWGNGMALPNMLHVMRGIVALVGREGVKR